jgi:hypothetical protein
MTPTVAHCVRSLPPGGRACLGRPGAVGVAPTVAHCVWLPAPRVGRPKAKPQLSLQP